MTARDCSWTSAWGFSSGDSPPRPMPDIVGGAVSFPGIGGIADVANYLPPNGPLKASVNGVSTPPPLRFVFLVDFAMSSSASSSSASCPSSFHDVLPLDSPLELEGAYSPHAPPLLLNPLRKGNPRILR